MRLTGLAHGEGAVYRQLKKVFLNLLSGVLEAHQSWLEIYKPVSLPLCAACVHGAARSKVRELPGTGPRFTVPSRCQQFCCRTRADKNQHQEQQRSPCWAAFVTVSSPSMLDSDGPWFY